MNTNAWVHVRARNAQPRQRTLRQRTWASIPPAHEGACGVRARLMHAARMGNEGAREACMPVLLHPQAWASA